MLHNTQGGKNTADLNNSQVTFVQDKLYCFKKQNNKKKNVCTK
jgi:hypothetical protein